MTTSARLDDLVDRIRRAHRRIRPHVRETPVDRGDALADGETEIHLKLENVQHTGSFKLRGATAKLTTLDDASRRRGVVTASSGNHGAAVAWAGRGLGVPVSVFVPVDASTAKVEAIRRLGAQVELFGDDCVDAEAEARRRAEVTGAVYVSPYNDLDVVAGQGTVAVELGYQVPPLDALILSIGGGGLASGVGAWAKQRWPGVELVAASPSHSAVMRASLEAGKILDLPSFPTLSDGTAGGVEAGSVTFELCQDLVDHTPIVDEDAIADAMRLLFAQHHQLVEGAAGVAVAAFLAERDRWRGARVGIVLCGANLSIETLRQVVAT